MDIVDESQRTTDLELKDNIHRSKSQFREGPRICTKCEEYNDRWEDGYCVCSECLSQT